MLLVKIERKKFSVMALLNEALVHIDFIDFI